MPAFHAFIARCLRTSLAAVHDVAERSGRGEQVSLASINNPGELARVDESVHHWGQISLAGLRRGQT